MSISKEFFISFFLFVLLLMRFSFAADLNLKVKGLRSDKGTLLFLVFNSSEGFPDKENLAIRKGALPASEINQGILIKDLPSGEYAVTLFHDENSNNKLDKKSIGLPDEGFAFSQNPTILFGPPSFARSSFKFNNDASESLKLKYY